MVKFTQIILHGAQAVQALLYQTAEEHEAYLRTIQKPGQHRLALEQPWRCGYTRTAWCQHASELKRERKWIHTDACWLEPQFIAATNRRTHRLRRSRPTWMTWREA